MFPDDELNQLQDRLSQMSDRELLRIVEVEYDDYRKEALEFAEAELTKRNVPFERQGAIQDDAEEDEEAPAHRDVRCSECGSMMSAGIMFADKELTMVFTDDNEERFVQAFGCKRCGNIRLAIDLHTEVEG
jgi:hypothetical protein